MLSVALALAPFFSGQTTNLSLHLQSAHGLKPQNAKGKNNRNQPKIVSLFAAPAGSNIPLTKAREEQITWAIGEYIVDGLLPISTVETSHFKKFMAVMEPRYTVPTRRTFKSKVMDKMEVQITSEIKEDLKQVEFCTITHDGWTSLANQSYKTATVHYVSKDWELKSKGANHREGWGISYLRSDLWCDGSSKGQMATTKSNSCHRQCGQWSQSIWDLAAMATVALLRP